MGGSLRGRAIRGGIAVLAGEAYANVIRVLANLIMTRLLYPEAFGLMLIVNLFLTALDMLSDVGVVNAIIAKQGALEDRFIDTAWTMLVVRGTVLTTLIAVLAYPVSLIYGEPQLLGLLLLVSLVPFLRNLVSPYPMVYEREVRPTRVILLNAIATTSALVITITWLLIHPTVWALAANGIFSSIITVVVSYILFPARRPQLCWDPNAVREIFRIGRWIVLGTGLTFFAGQGDRIIVSNWVTIDQLGVFSIAVALSRLLEALVGRLNYTVLLPVLSELRSGGFDRVAQELKKIKLAIFGICLPFILMFSLFGRDLISFLYDERYHDAGWMLEVLAAGSLIFAAGSALHTLPLSFADSYRHMWRQCLSVVSLLVSMLVGGWLAGFTGLIIGTVVAHALDYVILRIFALKYGVRDYWTDVMFLSAGFLIIGTGWYIRGWPWNL